MTHYAFLPSADLAYDSGSVLFAKQLANVCTGAGHTVSMLCKRRPAGYPLASSVQLTMEPDLLEHPVITDRPVSSEELHASQMTARNFLVNAGKVELVYAQYFSFSSSAAASYAIARNLPLFVSCFGRDLEVGLESDQRIRAYAEETLPAVTAVLVPSDAVKQRLLAFMNHGPCPPIHVIAPPLDSTFLDAAVYSPLEFQRSSTVTITTINSCFKEDKGIDVAIRACARLAASGSSHEIELRIVGTDDHPDEIHRARLISLAQALGVAERVRFLGFLSRAEVKAALEESDIFVDCRYTSGFSSVLLEALATGACICCTRTAAAEALISHGTTGLLFDAGSDESLGMTLSRLVEDAALRRELRRNAAAWFSSHRESFLPDTAFSNILNLFDDSVRT